MKPAHHHLPTDPTDPTDTAGADAPTVFSTVDGFDQYGYDQQLYLKEPGNAAPVSMFDINQGQISDCFLLSALGQIARQSVITGNHGMIPSMIHDNGDGSQIVKLYTQPNSYDPTGLPSFDEAATTAVYQYVSDQSFLPWGVNSQPGQAQVGTHKEIWPQVIEQAYIQQFGYDAVANGGKPWQAMEALTGKPAMDYIGSDDTASMHAWTNSHALIAFDTAWDGALPYGLVNDHSYGFGGYNNYGKPNETVNLVNPWGTGYAAPAPIPTSQLASVFVDAHVGHF